MRKSDPIVDDDDVEYKEPYRFFLKREREAYSNEDVKIYIDF